MAADLLLPRLRAKRSYSKEWDSDFVVESDGPKIAKLRKIGSSSCEIVKPSGGSLEVHPEDQHLLKCFQAR